MNIQLPFDLSFQLPFDLPEGPYLYYVLAIIIIAIGSRFYSRIINARRNKEADVSLSEKLSEIENNRESYVLEFDYSRLQSLEWLQQNPRELTPEVEEICNEIHPKPYSWVFWGGGVKGWEKRMEHARLSYIYVLQAHNDCYDPENSYGGYGVVIATAHPKSSDPQWIGEMGEKICLKIEYGKAPEASELLDSESSFKSIDLPKDITDGIPFKLFTFRIDAELLPDNHIQEKVLPALYNGKYNNYGWQLIPAKFYYPV
ncbi:MAG: hypothetical protein PF637_13115 [Spirochaetes bacterium]|jgi:hypothetical protein|nr:hypothetical protein [Spirochaetota bacterium]